MCTLQIYKSNHMSALLSGLTQAIVFASEKHKNRKRKNTEQTPYINHLLRVLNILTTLGLEQYSYVWEAPILISAVLHNTVGNKVGDATIEEIAQLFGKDVAIIVADVIHDKSLPKLARKKLQVQQAPNKSRAVKIIKMADKLDKMRDLVENLPVGWTDEMRFGYFVWSYELVKGLRNTNYGLENALDMIFCKVGVLSLSDVERHKELKAYYLMYSQHAYMLSSK